jgi:hypothetical protein
VGWRSASTRRPHTAPPRADGKTVGIVTTICEELIGLFPDAVFVIGADETHVVGNCTMANLRGFEEKMS